MQTPSHKYLQKWGLTENISPSAAAIIASKPMRAPVGTMIVPPVFFANSITSKRFFYIMQKI